MRSISVFIYVLLSISLSACLTEFEPNNSDSENLLVVEAFINESAIPQEVKLSRVAPIGADTILPETGAFVQIEEIDNQKYLLNEVSPGRYQTTLDFKASIGKEYRLLINTQDGREYASESLRLRATPPIDSVYARYQSNLANDPDGIYIFVDSQDPSGSTKFYRWEWEETYQIRTPFLSIIEWESENRVFFRKDTISICWAKEASSNILIKSTQGISGNRVQRFPLRAVGNDAPAFRIKYSILVKQYALNEQGFNFWAKLKEISEGQGSLFEIQPGIIRGNIRSLSSSDELVLGYFDAAQLRESRVFFVPDDFTDAGYVPPSFLPNCDRGIDSVAIDGIGDYMSDPVNRRSRILWDIVGATGISPLQYLTVPKECADCRNLGSNVRPDFWE